MAVAYDEAFYLKHPQVRQVMELFEFLPSAYFYAKDAEHRYVAANWPVLTEIFGMEQIEDLLGKSDLEIQAPAMAEAYHAEDRCVMDGGVRVGGCGRSSPFPAPAMPSPCPHPQPHPGTLGTQPTRPTTPCYPGT